MWDGQIYMYNIYTALVLIYIMYIYSVIYTSEAIAGGKRPDPFFFLGQGKHTSDKTHTRVKKERRMKEEGTIHLRLSYTSRATTLLRRCHVTRNK